MSDIGFVYAVESGCAVKIGWARDPVRRLSELNVGSPGSHRLIGFIAGTKDDERRIHQICRANRIRGEWFRNDGVVSVAISAFTPYAPKPTLVNSRQSGQHGKIGPEPAASIIRQLGGPSKVAAIVSVHRTRVSNWMRPRHVGGTGGRIPQAHHRAILRAAADAGITDITAESLLPPEDNESSAA